MSCVRLTLGNVKTLLVAEIVVAEILVDAVLWAWRFWIDVAETIGSDKTHGWKKLMRDDMKLGQVSSS